ncbi:MAG TPA: zinc ribbon domain-containing protein [Methanomassiliicoccales archaeon]|nr:zinc ribbon domain-containing protein [Methanomassiliicoccales archaeon]
MAGNGSSSNGNGAFEFDCPECGHHIVGEVTKCPNCGVEFVIEEVSEETCPSCGKPLPATATRCESCGAEFEVITETVPSDAKSEAGASAGAPSPSVDQSASAPSAEEIKANEEAELRHHFPELVAEVKPLLTLARDNGIDASEGRRLIDKAVRSGKSSDVRAAVGYVQECKRSITSAINGRLDKDTEYLEKLVDVAKSMNSNPAAISDAIAQIRTERDAGNLEGALRRTVDGKKAAEKLTGRYIEAHELSDQLESLIQGGERFYVDVREARRLLTEARDAGDHGDWSMMSILAIKGREEILKTLPDVINIELKKARSQLLDAKAEGKDVALLIKVLKEAGTAAKQEKYEDALERLVEFKTEAKYL